MVRYLCTPEGQLGCVLSLFPISISKLEMHSPSQPRFLFCRWKSATALENIIKPLAQRNKSRYTSITEITGEQALRSLILKKRKLPWAKMGDKFDQTDQFVAGLKIRREVLGDAYVDNALDGVCQITIRRVEISN